MPHIFIVIFRKKGDCFFFSRCVRQQSRRQTGFYTSGPAASAVVFCFPLQHSLRVDGETLPSPDTNWYRLESTIQWKKKKTVAQLNQGQQIKQKLWGTQLGGPVLFISPRLNNVDKALASVNSHWAQTRSFSPITTNQTENCYLWPLAVQRRSTLALSPSLLNSTNLPGFISLCFTSHVCCTCTKLGMLFCLFWVSVIKNEVINK